MCGELGWSKEYIINNRSFIYLLKLEDRRSLLWWRCPWNLEDWLNLVSLLKPSTSKKEHQII